jgi:PelA/Pel-15E family pectate lyase
MRDETPDERVVQTIDGAVAWLRRTQLSGIRVQRIPAPEVEFGLQKKDFDVVVRSDPDAKPIWARHYEIETDRPLFAGRDAVKRYALAEIERERRTGTTWYGDWPIELLADEYPAWRRKVANSTGRAP